MNDLILIPGSEKVIQVQVRNRAGEAADPETVLFTVKAPNSLRTFTYGVDSEVTKDTGAGLFTLAFKLSVSGTHYWRCETDGVVAAVEGQFPVKASYVI